MELIALLDPGNYDYLTRVQIMMFQSKYNETIQLVKDSTSFGPDNIFVIGWLGEAYAMLGDTTGALQTIKELDQLSTIRYVSNSIKAPIYMALGEEGKAFQIMEEALEDRDLMIHVFHWYVSIYKMRDDPRFVSLMERSWVPLEE